MRKLKIPILVMVCLVAISCRDNKKVEEKNDATIEKTKMVEKELDEINEDLNTKAKEAEDALNQLNN